MKNCLFLSLSISSFRWKKVSGSEVVEDSLVPLDYRYHCQDEHDHLLFRYDSTPHFPGLPNFPHHKHLSDDVIGGEKPDVEQVVQEAMEAQG